MPRANLILNQEKNQKDKNKIGYLEVYPLDKKLQLPSFEIKKFAPRFTVTRGEKTYIFSQTPKLEQAQNIFELFKELDGSYISKIFIKPVAIIRMEKLNFLYKPTKSYMIGIKDVGVENLTFSSMKGKEKIRLLGSYIFNLAKLHEKNIALGDVSLANAYKKIAENIAIFGPPSQLRVIENYKEGYNEFVLFLCNLKMNKLVVEKEIEIFIEHYLKSFEQPVSLEEKEKIMNLYRKYYEKYYQIN
ncbi:MAG: hypothetical protein N3D10_02725 [Candidatus Micrarchaeota archaeon]|nr:hypothetical protein [Candidatus Micrarchaeota archaeon]